MNRKLKISLYLAAIFAAGVVTGLFVSYQVARHMMPSREKMADHWCEELRTKLNLSPEQTLKIRPIIDQTMVDFSSNLTEQMVGALTNCGARVAPGLTPAQQAQLAQLQEERVKLIRRWFSAVPPPPEKKP